MRHSSLSWRPRPNHLVFVIGYYLPGLLASGLFLGVTRRPWVFWMDALEPLKQTGPWARRAAVKAIREWYLAHATTFLSTGEKGRRALLSAGISPDRAFEIPFVIDTDWIRSSTEEARADRLKSRSALGIPPDARVVLFVGQMIERKGLDLLIDAAARKPVTALHFLLIGEGVDLPTIRRQVEASRLSAQFHFLTNQDNSLLPHYWAASDAFVLPSRFDAWGVVVDEALSAGLPVLGSDACGAVVDRIKEGRNGWVFKTGDVDDLQHKLAKLGSIDAEALRSMSTAAMESMVPHSPRAAAHKFTEVVEATLRMWRRAG